MDWNLEGKMVIGNYLNYMPVYGEVLNSRVKLGGRVVHTVKVRNSAPNRIDADTVNLYHDQIRTTFSVETA